MEKAVIFRTIMNEPYREHPHEDALERFLMNQCEEEELDIVETHILACETCVTRLETLDLNLRALKLALNTHQAEQARQLAQHESKKGWFSWLTAPHLSFGGAALAACALAITMFVPRDVSLTAFRGNERIAVSEWLPLDLHLNARDLAEGPVHIAVVNDRGDVFWQGNATVQNNQIDVKIPRLTTAGEYVVQVHPQSDQNGSPLREFLIRTKPLL